MTNLANSSVSPTAAVLVAFVAGACLVFIGYLAILEWQTLARKRSLALTAARRGPRGMCVIVIGGGFTAQGSLLGRSMHGAEMAAMELSHHSPIVLKQDRPRNPRAESRNPKPKNSQAARKPCAQARYLAQGGISIPIRKACNGKRNSRAKRMGLNWLDNSGRG